MFVTSARGLAAAELSVPDASVILHEAGFRDADRAECGAGQRRDGGVRRAALLVVLTGGHVVAELLELLR